MPTVVENQRILEDVEANGAVQRAIELAGVHFKKKRSEIPRRKLIVPKILGF